MKLSKAFKIASIMMFAVSFLISSITVPAQTESKTSKAMVIIDPANKQNISGYVHIRYASGERVVQPRRVLRGLINLKEAMTKWTEIETKLDSPIRLSSPQLHKMPFIYITFEGSLELTEPEKNNIRKYLMSGGFMVLETLTPPRESHIGVSTFKKLFSDVIKSQGRFAPIPNSHPLYHCFFDFPNGPPMGTDVSKHSFGFPTLEGVTIGGRLAAIYSDKGYVEKWQESYNNDPQLKMGVNMIVFALTQKGGMTRP